MISLDDALCCCISTRKPSCPSLHIWSLLQNHRHHHLRSVHHSHQSTKFSFVCVLFSFMLLLLPHYTCCFLLFSRRSVASGPPTFSFCCFSCCDSACDAVINCCLAIWIASSGYRRSPGTNRSVSLLCSFCLVLSFPSLFLALFFLSFSSRFQIALLSDLDLRFITAL